MTSFPRGGVFVLMKVEICDGKKSKAKRNVRNDIERRQDGELDALPTS